MIPVRVLLTLVLLAALAPSAVAQPRGAGRSTAQLRDITVSVENRRAVITLLVDRSVGTVVTDVRDGEAQVRMRPIAAERGALESAVIRNGTRSVGAHIERKDVLVIDVSFDRIVRSMSVTRRTEDRVVVAVRLGRLRSDAGKSTTTTSSPAESDETRRRSRRWALSTIVIDPGHGGKDPGAIGVDGMREKDITLAVSKQIKRELQRRLPGVRVIMTRSTDEFVELDRRGQIANERDGRLFLSIHCNALPDSLKHINGFECYILRPGKSEDAARVVAAENSAVRFESNPGKYEEMAAENAIVATMAQSAFARYSETAAQAIRNAMRKGTRMRDRGVYQAGFYVLVGASMPAVLVELGYISNMSDAAALSTVAGRRKMAQAIVDGVVKYRKVYAASLK